MNPEVDIRNYLTRCTVFFPDWCELDPIYFYSSPPQVGTKVSTRCFSRSDQNNERTNYDDWYDWEVDSVFLVLDAVSSAEDAIDRNMHGLPGSVARYDVMVKGGKRFSNLSRKRKQNGL